MVEALDSRVAEAALQSLSGKCFYRVVGIWTYEFCYQVCCDFFVASDVSCMSCGERGELRMEASPRTVLTMRAGASHTSSRCELTTTAIGFWTRWSWVSSTHLRHLSS